MHITKVVKKYSKVDGGKQNDTLIAFEVGVKDSKGRKVKKIEDVTDSHKVKHHVKIFFTNKTMIKLYGFDSIHYQL